MVKINGVEVKIEKFPNGEKKVSEFTIHPDKNVFMLKWESDSDFMDLMFLKRHLDERIQGITELHIAYMPYSRQDRAMNGSVFTLKYLCDFINFLGFTRVQTHEAHSDVTPALLNHSTNVSLVSMLMNTLLNNDHERLLDDAYVFFPDAGAQKSQAGYGMDQLVGFKKRNLETGWIEDYKVFGEMRQGATVLILDDLSSYGGTFILAAEKLKAMGAGDIFLVIGHAEQAIFDGKIFKTDLIKKVFTTNSILDITQATDRIAIQEVF